MKTHAIAFFLLLAGCGGDNNVNPGSDLATGHDLAVSADLSVSRDLAATPADFSGIACGTQTCTGGTECCATQNGTTLTYACEASCVDGGSISLACDDPSQCAVGTPFCCGMVTLGAGVVPNCPITGSSMCAASCPTTLPTGCPDTGQLKLCHHAADCSGDSANPFCCEFSFNGNNISFCVSTLYKAASAMCFN